MSVIRISALDTANTPGVGYELLVRRASDGFYHDFDDDTFKAYSGAVSPSLAMTEDPDVPGIWTGVSNLDPAFSGEVDYVVRQTPSGTVHSSRPTYISAGEPLVDLARPEVFIYTHTGGFEALAVVSDEGDPVEGAVIRVYSRAGFDAGNLETGIIGMTTTDAAGYWHAPVPVSAGATYVIHVHKSTGFGPATAEVTV